MKKELSIVSKGKLLSLKTPRVMGILNATPDSFYASSRIREDQILDMAGKMVGEGASILDIGGQSTRPGAILVSPTEELDRVVGVVALLRKEFPDIWLSIDTFYSNVAQEAIAAGADIVNDISAGEFDTDMLDVVAKQNVAFIAMHKQGSPENMQVNPQYKNVTAEVLDYLVSKKLELDNKGVFDVILDPGFGFGKTMAHNFKLLSQLEDFGVLDRPILVGFSRKGMIQKTLGVSASEALNGTTVLNTIALMKGASILRVHDVKEAVECVKLWQQL